MPIPYLRRLTGKDRDRVFNLRLAFLLAFVAGATNAGGLFAVGQYTSHMSGIVSSIADNLAIHQVKLALAGLGSLTSFLMGAACTALLVNWGRRRNLHSQYAFPLMLEAMLLLCFGIMGNRLVRHEWFFVSGTVVLLCFIMGLQNAIITKLSRAEIRTTHVTGMVTDAGIELGKFLYWSRHKDDPVTGDATKLRILIGLVGLFFLGGLAGAISFQKVGYISTLPLAFVLVLLAVVPITDDLRERLKT